jgi:hypothetical protein
MKLTLYDNFKLLESEIHNTPPINPPSILAVLTASNISFTVVGAIAVNYYIDRPRNSQDVDVLTTNSEKLAEYVAQECPDLDRKNSEAVIRFSRDGKEVLDIMIPYHKIFSSVMTDTQIRDGTTIPSPEALIAMKFAAIMAKSRRLTDKLQDKTDIARILENQKISFEKINKHLSCLYPKAISDFKTFLQNITTLRENSNSYLLL